MTDMLHLDLHVDDQVVEAFIHHKFKLRIEEAIRDELEKYFDAKIKMTARAAVTRIARTEEFKARLDDLLECDQHTNKVVSTLLREYVKQAKLNMKGGA